MKRLIAFSIVMLLFCSMGAIGKPAENFRSYSEKILTGTTQNKLWIPGFRAEKIEEYITAASTTTITIYEPYNAGPASATDSFVVSLVGGGVGLHRFYYGPASDTMRVTCSTGTAVFSAYR